jgi:hypothetical protein
MAQTSITQLGVATVENFNTSAGTARKIPSRLIFSRTDFDSGDFNNFEQTYITANSTYASLLNAQSKDYAFGEKNPNSGSHFCMHRI